jgi:hypothetical protein
MVQNSRKASRRGAWSRRSWAARCSGRAWRRGDSAYAARTDRVGADDDTDDTDEEEDEEEEEEEKEEEEDESRA